MTDYDYVPVRVAGSRFGYNGEVYHRGDVLKVHEEALERHPNSLERAEDATVDEDGDDAGEEEPDADLATDDLDPHPEELNVGELEDRIADVDDIALLETIKKAEVATQDRSTATDAIDARIAAVHEE